MRDRNENIFNNMESEEKEAASLSPAALSNSGFSEDIIQKTAVILNKYSHLQFIRSLVRSVLATHAPSKSLLRLEHFLESSGSEIINSIELSDESLHIISSVFAASSPLSGRLNSDSELVRMLVTLESPTKAYTKKEYYLEHLQSAANEDISHPERMRAVHRVHTIQLMRICARNADPGNEIKTINFELSSLAEAVIETCLEIASREIFERTGVQQFPLSFVVLGLGKLGGRELNVSSDIDLIYLCGEDKQFPGGYDPLPFYTRIAERLTNVLTEATELGYMYRVDTRLRADGGSGPLVRTTRDYFRYLEMRGEAWERQMLLKARSVAGDIQTGDDFLSSVESFIFPSTLTRSPNREILELKTRIEARLQVSRDNRTHIKFAPGGIRDIEFTVQCLQLLMGGKNPDVRAQGTLDAIDGLHRNKALSDEEHDTLSSAYIFYRRIENAIQWSDFLASFSFPDKKETLDELATFLGFDEKSRGLTLKSELEKWMSKVRSIYTDVFSLDVSDNFELQAVRAAFEERDNERTHRFLESIGFRDPANITKLLTRLVFGAPGRMPDSTIPAQVERFAPVLLKTVSQLPDPSGTLERMMRIVDSYNARLTFYDVLCDNPRLLELLVSITHNSVFITDILAGDPSILDWLIEEREILKPALKEDLAREFEEINNRSTTDILFTKACHNLKNREKVRSGSRAIARLAPTAETFRELTVLAEAFIATVYSRAIDEYSATMKNRGISFGVAGAGRIGASMMDFGSDLDLIFIHDHKDESSAAEALEFGVNSARRILTLTTGGGGAHRVYEIDARLRPEGGGALLSIGLAEYARYFSNRAAPWERLALTRARIVAGNDVFGGRIMDVIQDFVYRSKLTTSELDSITSVRASMIDASLKRYPGMINVKSGPGGLADIDFVAQAYSVHYGAEDRSLRLRNTRSILSALGKRGLFQKTEASTLLEIYDFLSDVEKSLRMGSGRSINAIPESELEQARVARILGFENVSKFRKRLLDITTLSHQIYKTMMERLYDLCG